MPDKTNLIEAGVIVGSDSSRFADTNCLKAAEAETSSGLVSLGGILFNVFESTDAGAGNFSESKIYRAFHNDLCYEIVEIIHSGNIGNYPPGTKEFDRPKVSVVLETMAQSFAFVK